MKVRFLTMSKFDCALRTLITFMLFSSAIPTEATSPPSAHRPPGRSWKTYLRTLKTSTSSKSPEPGYWQNSIPESAVISWPGTEKNLLAAFQNIRDTRFLDDPDNLNFKRRLPWLYPADGCFMRADLARRRLESVFGQHANKVFAFGNLEVKTVNSPDGFAAWWYHVAVAFRFQSSTYVFDPAIEPQRPLLLNEWVNRMGDPNDIAIQFCDSKTYAPGDDCIQEIADEPSFRIHEDEINFLGLERQNLEELNRSVERELGDFPPWLENAMQFLRGSSPNWKF